MEFALNIPIAKLVQESPLPKGRLVAQMARALDLVRGISLYQTKTAK